MVEKTTQSCDWVRNRIKAIGSRTHLSMHSHMSKYWGVHVPSASLALIASMRETQSLYLATNLAQLFCLHSSRIGPAVLHSSIVFDLALLVAGSTECELLLDFVVERPTPSDFFSTISAVCNDKRQTRSVQTSTRLY